MHSNPRRVGWVHEWLPIITLTCWCPVSSSANIVKHTWTYHMEFEPYNCMTITTWCPSITSNDNHSFTLLMTRPKETYMYSWGSHHPPLGSRKIMCPLLELAAYRNDSCKQPLALKGSTAAYGSFHGSCNKNQSQFMAKTKYGTVKSMCWC